MFEPVERSTVLGDVAVESARGSGIEVVDPTPWLCYQGECPIVIGGTLSYRDTDHITTEYAANLWARARHRAAHAARAGHHHRVSSSPACGGVGALAIVTVSLSQLGGAALRSPHVRRQPARDRRPGRRAREGRPRHGLGRRGLRLRLADADGLPGRQDRDRSRSARASSTSSRAPRARCCRPRPGSTTSRPAAPCSGLGASGPQVIEGFHGLPYDKPLGRTREVIRIVRSGLKREPLESHGIFDIPLPEDQGLGLGKPLKMLDQARARHRPDLGRLARRQERPDDRGAGRRLAADPVHPRARQRRLGRRRSPPARPSATPSSARCRSAPAAWSRSARTSRGCSTSCARCTRSTSAAWAPAARTSTTSWPSTTATRRRPRRSRTSTSTARRRKPRRWSRRSGWRPATWSAPRRTSRSGSPPSRRPASPTSRSSRPPTTRPPRSSQLKDWVS